MTLLCQVDMMWLFPDCFDFGGHLCHIGLGTRLGLCVVEHVFGLCYGWGTEIPNKVEICPLN